MGMSICVLMLGCGVMFEVFVDVVCIDVLWSECIEVLGGLFLFGEFGIVDVMYVFVVMCFNMYVLVLLLEVVGYVVCVMVLLVV